jgi:hypothetical protein
MTGEQTNLFNANKEVFLQGVRFYASILLPRFWFSELRAKMDAYIDKKKIYVNPNWYGNCAARALKQMGYRQTGQYRKSPTITRRSGDDKEWCKGIPT